MKMSLLRLFLHTSQLYTISLNSEVKHLTNNLMQRLGGWPYHGPFVMTLRKAAGNTTSLTPKECVEDSIGCHFHSYLLVLDYMTQEET